MGAAIKCDRCGKFEEEKKMTPLEKILSSMFDKAYDEAIFGHDDLKETVINQTKEKIFALIPKVIEIPQKEWENMDKSQRNYIIGRNTALINARRAMGGEVKDEMSRM